MAGYRLFLLCSLPLHPLHAHTPSYLIGGPVNFGNPASMFHFPHGVVATSFGSLPMAEGGSTMRQDRVGYLVQAAGTLPIDVDLSADRGQVENVEIRSGAQDRVVPGLRRQHGLAQRPSLERCRSEAEIHDQRAVSPQSARTDGLV